MSTFTVEYWENFGKYGNITNEEVLESGPSAKKTNGDSYSEQDGNSVSKQNGNKNTIQVGWSNSLTYGFSFSTLGGASFSTTGGAAVSNHVGLKWGAFFGAEISLNAASSVKVTKGWAYTFDTVTKCESEAQKIESALKKTEIATALTRTIGQEITALTGCTHVVSGTSSATSGSFRVFSFKDIDMYSFVSMKLKSTLVDIESPTSLKLEGKASVAMTSIGLATISAAIIKVG